jgi:hypothetical protein
MHNEWIGRTGDNPDIFDSLASYLRNPPAREILMEKMIVGTAEETIATLRDNYGISLKSASKMVDMARSVGPSPKAVPDGTIVIRYIRIPRTDEVLYEIIESAPRVDGQLALRQLTDEWSLTGRRARTALNSAWEHGEHKLSSPKGIVRITYHGRSPEMTYMFSIEG